MPITGPINFKYGGNMTFSHPASRFIWKQQKLMKQGYTEYRAFEIVEKELEEIIQKQKDETRLLRGVALDQNAYSYLDRFQMVAELESQNKLRRMERDLPKYLRAQNAYIGKFESEEQRINQEAASALGMSTEDFLNSTKEDQSSNQEEFKYQRETIEGMIRRQYEVQPEQKFERYQPVLYKVIKDPSELAERESLTESHEKFLDGTEKILQLHHQRSHINDGLKHMSDRQLIQKVREAPTKLKRSAKSFLKRIVKVGAKLDDQGDLDLSEVKDKNVVKYLEKNDGLVKLTLMQADLEFEYPQKLEKMQIKADVIEMVNKEEEKFQFAAFAKEAEEARKRVLTYEEYFQLDPLKDGHIRAPKKSQGSSKGDTTYEQFLKEKESDNLFKNDLLELEYKFWETDQDKEERIQKLWIDLKRKNALNVDNDKETTKEQMDLNNEITEITRRVRWRVDQELVRRSIQPIFKENYYSYDKAEFLTDADFEFYKIKKLLDKNPKMLKDDPVLGIDYLKIINLIKQKKLLERTCDKFDPSSTVEIDYYDLAKNDLLLKQQEEQALEIFGMNAEEQSNYVVTGLENYDQDITTNIKKDKKQQAKEQLKIIKQFDTLAE